MKTKLGEYTSFGKRVEVFLYSPESQPDSVGSSRSTDKLRLELNVGISGIEGYRITKETDGEIIGELCFAPDIMYELFSHFKAIDKQEFPENYA